MEIRASFKSLYLVQATPASCKESVSVAGLYTTGLTAAVVSAASSVLGK